MRNVTTTPVTAEVREGVGVLTLDSPIRRNPLSVATMSLVHQELDALADRSDVRSIVLRATGPVFSAGHDLTEMTDRTVDDERHIFNVCTAMMTRIQSIPQPVVAAVQGAAVAAGCQLVATCDLAVASTAAVFGTPGVKMGLFCSTPMVGISRVIGRKRMLQMLLTGEVIDAATAADWGLVNEVVAPEDLDSRALELATQVAKASPLTLRVGKQAFYRQIDLPLDQAYAEMAEVMATNAITCDAQEGIKAFLDKRTPTWQGR